MSRDPAMAAWLATVEHTANELAARFERAHKPGDEAPHYGGEADAYADPTGERADQEAARVENNWARQAYR